MLKYPLNLNKTLNAYRNAPIRLSHQIQIKHVSNDTRKNSNTGTPFEREVKRRQSQAKKSIFIETPGDPNSNNEVAINCSRIGSIQNIFRMDFETKSHILVEFSNASAANEVIRTAYHPGNHFVDGKVHTKGRFFKFNEINDTKKQHRPINFKLETGITDQETILSEMRAEKSIDDQMIKLYKSNGLSDLSSRLRFFTALQIEEAISGVFHKPVVLPFGSSINGFGRMQSDLDMVLVSNGNRTNRPGQLSSMELGKPDEVTRYTLRNNLYVISSMARHWLQGVTEVAPVLNARVPIIKYFQTLTQLECDLSMGNTSGYEMSEMLYTFGEMDERVRPLVFYIRSWAKEFEILQSFPSLGLSNFMVTCLVIFFLQRLQKPILPPADDFVSFKETRDYFQHTIDIAKLNFKTTNTSTLSELLVEFFEYYSSFNFAKNAASIASGSIKANISGDSMFIYNPLDHGSNVSRNVSDFERNQFIEKCRTSRDALIKGKIDAVELLEFYRKNMSREKIDSFVNNMMQQTNHQDKQKSSKFNVKKLMKT